MSFSSRSFGRRAVAVLTLLLILTFGQRVGESLVSAVGGSNSTAPYSSLAFINPESASNISVGSSVEFRISNQSGDRKRYEWVARVDGKRVEQGSVIINSSQSSVEQFAIKEPGKLVISLVDDSIRLSGRVVGGLRSRKNAGQ